MKVAGTLLNEGASPDSEITDYWLLPADWLHLVLIVLVNAESMVYNTREN